MKKFGLLALVLSVSLFAVGCQEQAKKPAKVSTPASGAQAQPGSEEKSTEAAPAEEKKADDAKPAEEKKAE